MATQAPAKQPKITYSAVGGNLDEIHAQFDRALEAVRAQFGGVRQPFIAGGFAKGGGPSIDVRSPIDRDVRLGSFESASAEQVGAAVKAAKAAQKQWAALPWQERVAVMRRAAAAIRERRYEIAALMSIEVGKNRMESLGDAEESADLIDYYADTVEQNTGFTHPLGKLSDNEKTMEVLRPYGVFAVVSPFNFPLALATGMSSAALVAGNAVVLKPSVLSSFTAAALAQAYEKAGLPAGVFNLVLGSGSGVGERLVTDPHIDGIAFTGSHDVGMRLLREFGAGGDFARPCLGELGGKNAAIITKSADLDAAAEGVMRSAFGYGGQKCSACSRVYVDRGVAGDFIALLLEKTAKIVIGDPTKRDVYLGPVISREAAEKFAQASAAARKGGTVLAGGERLTSPPLDRGNFVEPTIAELPLDHEIFATELFLPFLALARVDSFDEAVRESNRVGLGLTGGLFSRDDAEIDRFFDEMEAGVLYVNRRTGATTGAWPGVQSFCGWKGSGVSGKGGCGPFYVAQFMREQSRTRMM
ncbi:MAG TPA: aldehyde dehydrogenase family protein [Candidatus Eremiobacteraceae bacterium]|nr:aldehyde dehydrogenase family protein [Candidatus Eremiobacteraceae bacterium]